MVDKRWSKLLRVRDKITLSGLAFMGLYFLILLYYKHYLDQSLNYSNGMQYVLSGIILIGFIILAYLIIQLMTKNVDRLKINLSKNTIIFIVIMLTVIPRLFMMFTIIVTPTSDFNMYYEMAQGYAQSGYFWSTDYIVVVAPNILLFIVALGETFKIFGSSIFVAQSFNLFFFTGAAICFYSLSSKFLSKNYALAATLFFIFEPNNILYSLLLGTEPIALFSLILAMNLVIDALRAQNFSEVCFYALGSGAAFCFSNIIRPNALVVLIGILIFITLYRLINERKSFIVGIIVIIFLSFGFIGTQMGYSIIENDVYQRDLGINYGWTLYEGLDNESYGGWTAENSNVLKDAIETLPPEKVQLYLLDKAIQRAKGYSGLEWVELIVRKGINIWVYNDFAYSPIIENLEISKALWLDIPKLLSIIVGGINFMHQQMLVLFSVCCFIYVKKNWNNRITGEILIFYLPILGTGLLHSFVTSIPRYHYLLIPMFFLTICFIIQKNNLLDEGEII